MYLYFIPFLNTKQAQVPGILLQKDKDLCMYV